jgi:hypothetical protein
MAIKFEKIQPGMTLYDRRMTRMGNTTMRSLGEWRVKVISVDAEARTALCSWNGNRPTKYHARNLEKLHTWSMSGPDVVRTEGIFGSVSRVRKMTKAELAARDTKTAPNP